MYNASDNLKSLKTIDLSKYSNFYKFILEFSLDILYDIVKNFNNIICSFNSNQSITIKKEIFDNIFKDENVFFNLIKYELKLIKHFDSINNLNNIKTLSIINIFSVTNDNIIDEFITSINCNSYNFFNTNKKVSNVDKKNNIKNIRLMLFTIFTCDKNYFSNKIPIILEKVKEIINFYSDITLFEIEIFLILRVLLIRFTQDSLNEIIMHLWPIIYNMIYYALKKFNILISNIVSNKNDNNNNNNNNLNLSSNNNLIDLPYSTIKLVEILNLINIEEFYLSNWVFFDTCKF